MKYTKSFCVGFMFCCQIQLLMGLYEEEKRAAFLPDATGSSTRRVVNSNTGLAHLVVVNLLSVQVEG